MKKERLVIVDGVRTPFCKAGTDLARLGAVELGRIAISTLLTRTGIDPVIIDEVVFGCVAQPVDAVNIARVIACRAGIPDRVPAITVHRNCASGCEALTQAEEKMTAGRGSVFVIGGTESMSQVPLLFTHAAAEKFGRLARARTLGQKVRSLAAFRPSDFKPRIGLQLGLTDPVCGLNMGETAEVLAREHGITREEQDAFALESHHRAVAAREKLPEEIAPVYLDGRDGSPSRPKTVTLACLPARQARRPGQAGDTRQCVIMEDNGPRRHQTAEALAKLKPVFDRTRGTVTAGNASQVTDGAVALLVMTERRAAELGFQPLGALVGYNYAGCEPTRMGLGPLFAIARAEAQTGLRLEDADLIEINEAFAAQVLAVLKCAESATFARTSLDRGGRPLGAISRERLNVNGGAIALGHPVGATGARLILTSLKELRRREAKRALVSLCVGGGQGAALWLEAT